MSFLDLSNELLHRIIQAVPRNDLLSLSLTCRWLYALCDKALKRHLTLKKYSTVSFGNYCGGLDSIHRSYNPEVHADAKDAMLLIEDIIKDPEIMEYPEIMCLGNCIDVGGDRFGSGPWDDEEKEIYRKRQSVINHRSSEWKRLIEDCDFIFEEEEKSSFATLCNPSNEGVAVGLALTMLPNLKRIATQDWMRSYSSDRICPIVVRIAEANQDSHSPFHNKALTNLREFFMSHRDDEGGEDVRIFIPFAMLPSMRYLGGTEISAEENYIPHVEIRPGSSLVTEIEFLHSAISAENFYELLSGISALRKFTYHHDDLTDFDCRYEVREIVRLLRKYAASSLQHLDIVTYFSGVVENDVKHQQCVGFLQMFTVLQVIRLEDVAFQDPSLDNDSNYESLPLEDGCFDVQEEGDLLEEDNAQEEDDAREEDDVENEGDAQEEEELEEEDVAEEENDAREEEDVENEDDAQEEDEFEEGDDAEEAGDVENENSLNQQSTMSPLVDFLPFSVESLTLVQTVENARRQKLLCGLLEERSEKLPHLKILIFEGKNAVDDGTKAALEEAGLIVELRAKPSE